MSKSKKENKEDNEKLERNDDFGLDMDFGEALERFLNVDVDDIKESKRRKNSCRSFKKSSKLINDNSGEEC